MKPLLLKRGDVMIEYGIGKRLMEAIEKSRTLRAVMVPGYRRKLYRRMDVERFVYGARGVKG